MAQLSLDKQRFVQAVKKVISCFEVNHCVANIDAHRYMALGVILKYATNVDGESCVALLEVVWSKRGSK